MVKTTGREGATTCICVQGTKLGSWCSQGAFDPLNAGQRLKAMGRGEIRVRLTPAHPRIAQAPGGSTLGPEQVEPGADFTQLGMTRFRAELWSLTLEELEFLYIPTDLQNSSLRTNSA